MDRIIVLRNVLDGALTKVKAASTLGLLERPKYKVHLKPWLLGGINAYTPNLNAKKAKSGDRFKLLTAEEVQDRQES